MKIQWYKRLICCIAAVILFGTGMCVDIKDADSYLSYEIHQHTEKQKYSQQYNFISTDYCTNELIQRNYQNQIRSNQKREHVRRVNNNLLYSALWNVPHQIFYFAESFLAGDCVRTFNQKMIIEYIHRQDGDK